MTGILVIAGALLCGGCGGEAEVRADARTVDGGVRAGSPGEIATARQPLSRNGSGRDAGEPASADDAENARSSPHPGDGDDTAPAADEADIARAPGSSEASDPVQDSDGGAPAARPAAEVTPPSGPEEAPASSSQDPSPERILRSTSRAYEGLRSFRAGFDQRLRNTLLGRTTESQGTLYQRQPDRFLMDFSDPEGDLIVSDGDYFWMYFPSVDEKQVLRTPRGAQGLDLHAQFIGDPMRRFEATYHGMEAVRGRPAHVMTLVPREPMGYRSLKAWIDAEDHLVRRFELAETNGNIREFVLHDLVVNPSLPDEFFQFTPPPGSQVVTR